MAESGKPGILHHPLADRGKDDDRIKVRPEGLAQGNQQNEEILNPDLLRGRKIARIKFIDKS
jgi:hypothetical protein